MPILECGFLAGGVADPTSSKDIFSAAPVVVGGPQGASLTVPFQGGWGFALAATSQGRLYSWGVNQATVLGKQGTADDGADPGQLDVVAEGVSSAAAGFDHGLVVAGGVLHAFGPGFTPRGVSGLHLARLTLAVPVAKVSAGEHHSLVLGSDGSVHTLGEGREGQLGHGGVQSLDQPRRILESGFSDIAAGARHSLAVDGQGRVHAWGWGLHGQTGGGEATPAVLSPTLIAALGPLRVTGVAAGMAHSLALTDAGDVYAWGRNDDGQLGTGDDGSALKPKLVDAASLENQTIKAVAAGARHSLALSQDGTVFAWGYAAFGQLGTGSYANAPTPTPVKLPAGAKAAAIAAGWWHSLIATE